MGNRYNMWVFFIFFQVIFVLADLSENYPDTSEHGDAAVEAEIKLDTVPAGFLPNSVYRKWAWYGIYQNTSMLMSAKNKAIAKLIWQHTIGRPSVVIDDSTQGSQNTNKVSRQIVAEEQAKWSQEQRTMQDLFMDNIKSGGNGITVRTVISAVNKTALIIDNGKYYKCPNDTEPDIYAYKMKRRIHERICTNGKEPELVSVDPCMDVEFTPLEYSFNEGWMFCLGKEDRDNDFFKNGTLDCGNKTKVFLTDFLTECAIDNNVVITYDYFGEQQQMSQNETLMCNTWNPCRVSYMYRFEPPMEIPPHPTEGPCDTTVCVECLEGATEDQGVQIEIVEDTDRK